MKRCILYLVPLAEADMMLVVTFDNQNRRVMKATLEIGSSGEDLEDKIFISPGLTDKRD